VVRNWRVLTAIAAVVLATLTGFLGWQYLDDADSRAEADLDQVDILVAQSTIQRGTQGATALDAELIKTQKWLKRDVPATAVSPDNLEALRPLFASGVIAEGVPIVASDFVEAGAIENTALQISEGKQAVTISASDTSGVARFIAPGDTVSMLVTLDLSKLPAENNPNEVKEATGKMTAFLLNGLKVLAVGQTTTIGTGPATDTNNDGKIDDNDEAPAETAAQSGLLTFEATPREAEQIIQAQTLGTIYLTLNPPDFDVTAFQTPEEIVEQINLFNQPLTKLNRVIDQLAPAQG
jgi:pilus assembly protein CpaB